MADIPNPRSYSQILGSMITAFQAQYPIEEFRVGGPLLTMLEAAAQSDFRASIETLSLFAATTLASASGTALERLAADENTARLGASPSSGTITVGDSRYSKIYSTIYTALPPPSVSSFIVYIANGANFPLNGQIFIGRGTVNYEGPITYASKLDLNGNPWSSGPAQLVLGATPTSKFHNWGETVVLAQGGDRTVPAGSVCSTTKGTSQTQYSVNYSITLLDGEVEYSGVQVSCNIPGTTGNVPINSIIEWQSPPFTGATCRNIVPLTNGVDTETDDQLRDRILNLRQSRTRATALALKTYLEGVEAKDENKRIISSNILVRENEPTTVFIDDGVGYEEVSSGVANEWLNEQASGGEQYFQLSLGRPVAKAALKTGNFSPFNIIPDTNLTVQVAGIEYIHQFNSADFRSPTNATAWEIAHSINSNTELAFNARTEEGGQRVVISAIADTNEDIQVIAGGANDALLFPLHHAQTCFLYKNDVLLNKDGDPAKLYSAPQAEWLSGITDGATLEINVDGTGTTAYTISNSDFVTAQTGFNTVATGNSLAAWCKVFEAKIPGISANVANNKILLTSNVGTVARGSLEIVTGTLVSSSMFTVSSSIAKTRDYTLNRNTGQLKLTTPLIAGDKLEAGSFAPRAFVESAAITTVSAGGSLYFVIDGDAQIIPTGISGSTTLTFSYTFADPGPDSVRSVLVIASDPIFIYGVMVGDWVIFGDPDLGFYRISDVGSNYLNFEQVATAPDPTGVITPTNNGFAIVRTSKMIQKHTIASASYTAFSLAAALNPIEGATASVERTQYVRISTNSYGSHEGQIACVLATETATNLGFPIEVVSSNDSQQAIVESTSSDIDLPELSLLMSTGATATDRQSLMVNPGAMSLFSMMTVVGLKHWDWATIRGYDSKIGFTSTINSTSEPIQLRKLVPEYTVWFDSSRFFNSLPWGLSPTDDFSLIVDQENVFKNFTFNLGRQVIPSGIIGQTNVTLLDSGGDGHLTTFLGYSFDLKDWAFWRHASGYSEKGTSTGIKWLYYRPGPAGDNTVLRYQYPIAPLQQIKVTPIYTTTSTAPAAEISLISGPARSLTNVATTMRIGVALRGNSGARGRKYIVAGLRITGLQRTSNVVTATLDFVDGTAWGSHGLQSGQIVYIAQSGGTLNWASGAFTLTSVGTNTIVYTDGLVGEPDGSEGAGYYGNVTFNTVGGADFSGVQVHDIVHISPLAVGLSSELVNAPFRVVSKPQGELVLEVYSEVIPATVTATAWGTGILGDVDYLSAFPISGNTPAAIANGVNGMVTAIAEDPLSVAEVVYAGWDNALDWSLVDGINYISDYGVPIDDYVVDFKIPVTNSGDPWDGSESMWIVPTTTKNVIDYFNLRTLSALPENATAVSTANGKIQFITNTIGSDGSVQVSGGLANSMAADVNGSASDSNGGVYCYIPTAQSSGLHTIPNEFISMENTNAHVKTNSVSIEELTGISGGVVTVDGALQPELTTLSPPDVYFEKRGKYTFIIFSDATNAALAFIGGWITINDPAVSPSNNGVFRILYCAIESGQLSAVVIENDNSVDEVVPAIDITLNDINDMMVGDKLTIGDDSWGVTNRKTFTINAVGTVTFTVEEPIANSGTVAGPHLSVKLFDRIPAKFCAMLQGLAPHPTETSLTGVLLANPPIPFGLINESFGTKIRNLRKFAFSTTPTVGIDGYRYNTGLIGEANKVLYGDETDTATYPGVIAAGANVNISGPTVRRITLSFALRLRTGAVAQQVFDGVRNAISTYINEIGVGESIAISKIIAVAEKVGGVAAITVLSPVYSVGFDLISVQPYEKPMILAPDTDILLSVVG